MPLEHVLNAEFDLSLRPRWRWPEGAKARRRITDLQWHGLFLADQHDSVVVPEPVPGDFSSYLGDLGIEIPKLTIADECRVDQVFSPFGWCDATADRNTRYRRPAKHPDLDVVRRVNARSFSANLENTLFGGDHTIAEITSEAGLRATLSQQPTTGCGWLLKAEHGNAGLGNRRLRRRKLEPGDLTAVRRLFDEDDGAVLEHWRERLSDLCATFSVTPNGGLEGFGLHEVVNTADGALIGNCFHDDPTHLDPWRGQMEAATARIAEVLGTEGYVGPVCVDAFIWEVEGRPSLRPLVDLNARREISAGASALWRRLGAQGSAYWRFYTRRKITIPESYDTLVVAFGDDAYDPRTGRGVLVTAPLWLGPDRRAPEKAAVLFLSRNRDEALALDARFRKQFER